MLGVIKTSQTFTNLVVSILKIRKVTSKKKKRARRSSRLDDEKLPKEVLEKRLGLRKVRLSISLIDDFCSLIKRGLPPNKVCLYLCVSSTRMNEWLRLGREYLLTLEEGKEPEEKNLLEAAFTQRVANAEADWQLKICDRSFQEKYKATWTRDVTLLERRDRSNWGRNQIITVDEDSRLPDSAYM